MKEGTKVTAEAKATYTVKVKAAASANANATASAKARQESGCVTGEGHHGTQDRAKKGTFLKDYLELGRSGGQRRGFLGEGQKMAQEHP